MDDQNTETGEAPERDIKAEIEALQQDLKNLKAALGQKGSETLHDLGDMARERSDEAVTQARTCIHNHPFTCVFTALGAGMLLGLFIRR